MNIATTFAAHVENTAPKAAIDASFERMIERHGLTYLSVSLHAAKPGMDLFYSVSAHRDLYIGHNYGDTIEQAVSKALADLTAKCGMIGLEGEL